MVGEGTQGPFKGILVVEGGVTLVRAMLGAVVDGFPDLGSIEFCVRGIRKPSKRRVSQKGTENAEEDPEPIRRSGAEG
jgi:hypothetical protein